MSQMFTYQARITVEQNAEKALSLTTEHLSHVERVMFAATMSGKSLPDIKKEYLKRFGITARQFNACRTQIEGKIESLTKLQSLHIKELKEKITHLESKLKRKTKKLNRKSYFQKKRRLERLEHKLKQKEEDKENGIVSLCFGTKKLFRAQNHLSESGFKSRDEWQKKWKEVRKSECFFLGSKDESGGNQTCTASIQEDGKITLRIRLPNTLCAQFRKYLILKH